MIYGHAHRLRPLLESMVNPRAANHSSQHVRYCRIADRVDKVCRAASVRPQLRSSLRNCARRAANDLRMVLKGT